MSETDWSDLDMTELLPTGTVTLLLADVEGSTQLWESQPDTMAEAIDKLGHRIATIIAEHNGVRPLEQGEGDSFVAAFSRASDAAACAIGIQRADLMPIRLRIGIHTGEVRLRDEGNYAGPSVNKTARLRDLAHGGQTLLSGATAELVEDRLPPDTWLIDMGAYELRDIARPVRVSQLCHAAINNEFAALRTSKAPSSHNLPSQLTSFIGRGAQIAEICDLLSDNRLLTLTGAGGAGKTRLAQEVAGRMASEFPDGVRYADLAPITHPDVVPLAVARALGLPDHPGRSITETVLRSLKNRSMLLVIDNCEHVLQASAILVNDLLADCPNVTVFATSREPLMVAGEVNWQVPSLSLDDEAVELFCDRARRARPAFAMTETNAATVTEICRRLDGMPLAIELAAARVRALSLEEILDSLHDRFRLLTGGARTAVRRQQTLRASVDWSHALLTESERILLRRLAVFMGGFDRDAAQAVACSTEAERYQAIDQLGLLVDKSLVVAESASGPTRYRLLETVRQYALEKLGESGEGDAVRTRHRDHYLSLAALLDASDAGEHERGVAQALNEMDNLRAAFTWSHEKDETTLMLDLASFLQSIWLGQGRIREGMAWIDAALAASAGVDTAESAARARAIADKALLDSWSGSLDTPDVEDLEAALAYARAGDDKALLTRVLVGCGCIAIYEFELAETYFTEAADLARELNDSLRLASILERLAYIALIVTGDPNSSLQRAVEARRLAQRIGDHLTAHQCGIYIAGAQFHRGELRAAVNQARAVAAECTAADNLQAAMVGLMTESIAMAMQGEASAAKTAISAALNRADDVGDFFESACYPNVALAHLAAGDVPAAWEAAERAIPTITHLFNGGNINWVVIAALCAGEIATARRMADIAASKARGAWLALALTNRARVKIACNEWRSAAEDLYGALAAAEGTTAVHIPDDLECLAHLDYQTDNHHEAARLLGAAHSLRKSLGTVRLKVFDDDFNLTVAAIRDAFGDNEFEMAWTEGAALTIEEAIGYAQRGRGERRRPSTGWDSLTPTELDVVRLVAEGMANKDIASRLFISPRTVQSHLRHVYNKLGLRSRVQLAQAAATRTAVSRGPNAG